MSSTQLKKVRFWKSAFRVLLALVMMYLGGYVVLMNRSRPAVLDGEWGNKPEGYVAAFSSFRWAKQWHSRPVYSNWNAVFEPLDKIYFSVFPSTVTMDTRYQ